MSAEKCAMIVTSMPYVQNSQPHSRPIGALRILFHSHPAFNKRWNGLLSRLNGVVP
jgi:hypothetical protein